MGKTGAELLLAEWDSLLAWEQLAMPQRTFTASERSHLRRTLVALRLGTDYDTISDLILGNPVDPSRLDKAELARCKNRKLVQLNITEIDLLEVA